MVSSRTTSRFGSLFKSETMGKVSSLALTIRQRRPDILKSAKIIKGRREEEGKNMYTYISLMHSNTQRYLNPGEERVLSV